MPDTVTNFNYPESFGTVCCDCGICESTKPFLKVYPRNAYRVEILYFVVYCHSLSLHLMYSMSSAMRQQYKSNTGLYHKPEGGAVPTLTHQDDKA